MLQSFRHMKKLPSLSIFFPSLNDAKILPYLIAKTYAIAPLVAHEFDVTVINDGSTDETETVLAEMEKHYHNFHYITHRKNKGYGGALQSGFKNAKHEWVFYTDGDGQYDPTELKTLVEIANENIDVVNGFNLARSDNLLRRLIGSAYNSFARMYYLLPISDFKCDFRLIRRSLLDKIHLRSNSGAICLELVEKMHKAGGRFVGVGIHHYPRQFGRSQFFRPKHILHSIFDLIFLIHIMPQNIPE